MASLSESQSKANKPKKRKRDGQERDGRHSKRQRSKDRRPKTNGKIHDTNNTSKSVAIAPDMPQHKLEPVVKPGLQIGAKLQSLGQGDALTTKSKCKLVWRISKPMGGRMLDIDPILTEDEKHLIITYNTSIQVYSTEDSLLVRRIPVQLKAPTVTAESWPYIVATRLSQSDTNHVWVASSDGFISQIDWTNGNLTKLGFRTTKSNCVGMALLTLKVGDSSREVVFASERLGEKAFQITAYDKTKRKGQTHQPLATLSKQGHEMLIVESSQDGFALFGSLGQRLFTMVLQKTSIKSIDQLKVETYTFDASDIICSMDMKVSRRREDSSDARRMSQAHAPPVVDLLAGGARGAIYLYQDLLGAFSKTSETSRKFELQARKYHWHRRAVHSVKWSRDGNYMISGGSENTLVMWQRDTGKQDFLPHLSAGIENIVVSSRGASYTVHLNDNSTMVLSTAELKPTTYVAGLQSAITNETLSKDLLVKRIWSQSQTTGSADGGGGGVIRPLVAAMNPQDASKLHLCVGGGYQMTIVGKKQQQPSPWLQSFDLETFRTQSRHAIARTQTTSVNENPKGHPIIDPTVTHCAFSANGKWMATIDEWEPSSLDVQDMSSGTSVFLKRQRREVHLKFWEVGTSEEAFALVSRINSPHATTFAERVLDLAARRDATMFATVGNDGVARLWRPRMREQDGVPVRNDKGECMQKWICSTSIDLGSPSRGELPVALGLRDSSELTGSLAFSEDGSTLFVAFGDWLDGTVHIVDTRSGQVRHSMQEMWKGSICRMVFVSPYLVTLSDKIRVHDVVAGETKYAIDLPPLAEGSLEKSMIQLGADHVSGGVCAVVFPNNQGTTDLAIFRPELDEPLAMWTTVRPIIGLVSNASTGGFVVLDDGAQLHTLSTVAGKVPIKVAQPLADTNLHSVVTSTENTENTEKRDIILANGYIKVDEADGEASDAEEQGHMNVDDMNVDMDEGDGDGNAPAAVIGREKLAEIFDVASAAFTMPPVEEMFYKVVDMVVSRPVET